MDVERRYFRHSLIFPKNLIIDGASFLKYFGRAFKLRLYKKVKPAHVWTKIKPSWLPDCIDQNLIINPNPADNQHFGKPRRYLYEDSLYSSLSKNEWPDSDPEKYWHFHRWGWLSHAFLEGSASRQEAFNWIESWIENNKDYSDPAWEPFSCSERIANLYVLISYGIDRSEYPGPTDNLSSFIYKSAYWIIGHLEYYGLNETNNHIINNARALVLAAVLSQNQEIINIAFSILRNMLPLLISKEGFLRERSSHYQMFVLRWVMDVNRAIIDNRDLLIDKADKDLIVYYGDMLAKASSCLCDSKGDLKALIGDVSPDLEPAKLCRAINTLYPEWRKGNINETFSDQEQGWFFIKKARFQIITNQPKQYPADYSNHGHADVASFVFLVDDKPVIVDPGRNSYTRSNLSKRFLSGFFHNVPVFDGIPPAPAPFFKKWMPHKYGSVRIKSCLTDGEHIKMEHDGFSRTGSKTLHVRTLSLTQQRLKVSDEFRGRGKHQITLCWHFSPSFKKWFKDKEIISLASDFCSVRLSTNCNRAELSRPEISFYKSENKGGWYSPCYGRIEPAVSLHIHMNIELPVIISSVFDIS